MNITFLRPLLLPATIRIESKVVQDGRYTALARGEITSKDGSKVYFICEHHKVKTLGQLESPT